ncbi:cell number regulator 1-like [Lycium ferocissimum]|uniref:cell number regulator 1-like n=1 Tax=Lycium ferocissimum TaxID=112874 RepID=UPI0028164678|nr:cell number regulator 1-like [Lycium ferocissimum]
MKIHPRHRYKIQCMHLIQRYQQQQQQLCLIWYHHHPKFLLNPPRQRRLSSSSTRIPWPGSPPFIPSQQQPPICHQSSIMPYYPPIGVPPPFPYFPMPYPRDQFHYPMILANNGQIYSQPWSTGLFDCFSDLKNCFITCLCPCVTFGQVDEILSEGSMTWWEGALMFGILDTLCFSQASFIFAWYHRVQFRKKYNLMGNLLSEFAITLCCMRLVLCQNYRQLNKLGFDVALGWKANKKKQRRIASQGAVQFVPPMTNPGMFR